VQDGNRGFEEAHGKFIEEFGMMGGTSDAYCVDEDLVVVKTGAVLLQGNSVHQHSAIVLTLLVVTFTN